MHLTFVDVKTKCKFAYISKNKIVLMDWQNFILDILKMAIPAVLVIIAFYIILKQKRNDDESIFIREMQKEAMSETLPKRLSAYERLIIFLERINPPSLMTRIPPANMSAKQYQAVLIANIRTEFEHNLAQQIYVEKATWYLTAVAKENVIALILGVAQNIGENAKAQDLQKMVLASLQKMEEMPTQAAVNSLLGEVKNLFPEYKKRKKPIIE